MIKKRFIATSLKKTLRRTTACEMGYDLPLSAEWQFTFRQWKDDFQFGYKDFDESL